MGLSTSPVSSGISGNKEAATNKREENVDPRATREIGQTGVAVTQLGFGSAHFGEFYSLVKEEDAQATVAAAYDAGVRLFDTAPWYGCGLSEHRLGTALRQRSRGEFLVSTKIGRVLTAPEQTENFDNGMWLGGLPFQVNFDYTHDGVMRSWEDSLQRLSLNRVDLLIIHDLDFMYHETEDKVQNYLKQLDDGGGFRALSELKAAGRIKAIGAGINQAVMIPRFLDRFDLDFFLVAMPYTLIDQDVLKDVFPRCQAKGMSVIIGSPYASGILATGVSGGGAKYNYADAPAEIVEKVAGIETICARHNVALQAAALQFPLGHPMVASIIPGAVTPEQVRQNVAAVSADIPAPFWAELKAEGLLANAAPVPT